MSGSSSSIVPCAIANKRSRFAQLSDSASTARSRAKSADDTCAGGSDGRISE